MEESSYKASCHPDGKTDALRGAQDTAYSQCIVDPYGDLSPAFGLQPEKGSDGKQFSNSTAETKKIGVGTQPVIPQPQGVIGQHA
jgi:hypothetical protein